MGLIEKEEPADLKKKQVRVSIDPEVFKEAKRLGLNVSAVCERALRRGVEALKVVEGEDGETSL